MNLATFLTQVLFVHKFNQTLGTLLGLGLKWICFALEQTERYFTRTKTHQTKTEKYKMNDNLFFSR